jgi:hypothetical protein
MKQSRPRSTDASRSESRKVAVFAKDIVVCPRIVAKSLRFGVEGGSK